MDKKLTNPRKFDPHEINNSIPMRGQIKGFDRSINQL